MALTIQPIPASTRLQESGDIETVLQVPFDDDRFFVGLSDGTLLLGFYDEDLRCLWSVAREGAALLQFDGSRVTIEWTVEWVTAGLYDANLILPIQPAPLPLFPGLDQLAA